MTIAQRLYALIFAVVVGLVSLAGLGIYQMAQVYAGANYANINTVPSLLALDDAFRAAAQLRVQVWQYMALKDAPKRSDMTTAMGGAHAKVIEAFNKYEKEDLSNDDDKALLTADRNALTEYDVLLGKVKALAKDDKSDEARDLALANRTVSTKLADAMV